MSSNLIEFSKSISTLPIRVGSINQAQQGFIYNFLQGHPEIKNILETGFHVGLSAAIMMEARPDIRVVSSDIFWFDYTRRAKLLLDIYYPGRSTLLAGNSVNTLPTLFNTVPYTPDFVFIDGGHERPVPYIDLYHILNHIKPGTPIMIDDYCQEHGQHGVIEGVDYFISRNCLEKVEFHKSQDRGWVFGYRSSTPMPPFNFTSDAINKVLRDTESHYLNENTKEEMSFTFGIITAGGADVNIEQMVNSIKQQNIKKYEIIIVGNTSVKGCISIPFDETIKNGWITKKKNMIAQLAKYENIVFLHDYVELSTGWYEGFIKYGNDFKICINPIKNRSGKRFRDFCLFKEFLTTPTLLPYSAKLNPSLSKLAYVSGSYYVIKRDVALSYPLDERLGWNQGEDVIFSQTLSKNGVVFQCNPFSTVTLLKEKDSFEQEINQETFNALSKFAEVYGEELFQKQCQFQESWVSQFWTKAR